MQVQKVAKDLGVSPDTVRYYTRAGLLEPNRNPANGYKDFSEEEHADKDESPCQLVRQLIEDRLDEVNKRFEDMARLKGRMETAVEAWRTEPDHAPTGDMICYLIENFSEDT